MENINLTKKELTILEELKCYDTKFECAKDDVGTDFLKEYYSDWENLKRLFEDWALDGVEDYYFVYKGLHFICRIENIYENIQKKDIIALIDKLNFKNAKDFNKIKRKFEQF